MAERRFPILGTDVPPMLGRANVIERLWTDLTKTTPSHLSLVGPRYSGKSVLLRGLAKCMARDGSPYKAVILWDLGHQTPGSDDDFLRSLCRTIGEGIMAVNQVCGEHLLSVKSDEYNELREVINILKDDGTRVLMLWDGFDKPLGAGKLTRNLWDQLRELLSSPSLRLVTATRRTLHELIRSEESVTSDFWNIFDMNPVRVDVFDDDDREAVLAMVPDIAFDAAARSELEYWTAGYPPLYLAVINQVIEMHPTTRVDNKVIRDAAGRALEHVSSILKDLWTDCPATAKDIYGNLVRHGPRLTSEIGKRDLAQLAEKGFVKRTGNKTGNACGLLERYLDNVKEDAGSMFRLFGPWEEYRGNIRSLLQLRLSQMPQLDDRLRRLIARSIEDIPDFPHECLTSMRGISDRALDLIWEIEFGTEKTVPSNFIEYWEYTLPLKNDRKPHNLWLLFPENKVPTDRSLQCRLLQCLTGSALKIESRAKFVSKNTYCLVNAIQGFGNFGQHLDNVHEGVAIAAVMCCIELAACLEAEIRKKQA